MCSGAIEISRKPASASAARHRSSEPSAALGSDKLMPKAAAQSLNSWPAGGEPARIVEKPARPPGASTRCHSASASGDWHVEPGRRADRRVVRRGRNCERLVASACRHLDVGDARGSDGGARLVQHARCEIDRDDAAGGADAVGTGDRGEAGARAGIEMACPGRRPARSTAARRRRGASCPSRSSPRARRRSG